jgi:hypothetical protein
MAVALLASKVVNSSLMTALGRCNMPRILLRPLGVSCAISFIGYYGEILEPYQYSGI